MSKRALMARARRATRRMYDRISGRVFPETTLPSEHLVRFRMNQEIASRLDRLDVANSSAAEISGANHADRPWGRFQSLDYPDFDLCAPLEKEMEGRFDVVLCEQVLEHVEDPVAAARHLAGLVREGGLVVVSTPFMIRVHELPMYGMYDYWRFTPRGLRRLLETSGLEVEEVGHWGNREAVLGNLDHWSARRRWHPMYDEPDVPVQVWAFARRPGSPEPEEASGSFDANATLTHRDPSQLAFQIAEVFGDRTYLQHGVSVGPGDVVVDAGANVGVSAAFFLHECGVARVHSFEPVPEIFAMLSENVGRMPDSPGEISLYPFGLSASSEEVEFTYYEGAAAMSGRYADPDRDRESVRLVQSGLGAEVEDDLDLRFEGSPVSCRLEPLSAVISEQGIEGIDLLKIDVERAELEVLGGIDEEHWPLIRQVVIETHDDAAFEQARKILEQQGFEVSHDQLAVMRESETRLLYAIRP